MNIINEKVNHTRFGDGAVIEQASAMITVKFDESDEPKKFVYPDAFASFLRFCDSEVQARLDGELRLISDRLEEEKKLREEEAAKHLEELRLAALVQKRAAAKRTSAAKKAPAVPNK
ncbi:MAG: hypothetical protein LBN00_11685 [Oscillospiraceae bacterium]|jgi:hypothetical protein|nr:hypothetical protein [Oscillospiraceae bacterium]